MKRFLNLSLLCLASGLLAPTSQAQTIPTTGISPLPALSGNGLNGTYFAGVYQNSVADPLPPTATGTFVSTLVDYPHGATFVLDDSSTISDLLGSDASTLTAGSANTLSQSLFSFNGFLRVDTPGDIVFVLGSDDGSELRINSVQVINNDGDHGFNLVSSTATFTSPGLYPVSLIYFEHFGQTGVELYSSLAGGLTGSQTPAGTTGILPTEFLYRTTGTAAVPEPGTLSLLLGVGATGVGFLRKRRK